MWDSFLSCGFLLYVGHSLSCSSVLFCLFPIYLVQLSRLHLLLSAVISRTDRACLGRFRHVLLVSAIFNPVLCVSLSPGLSIMLCLLMSCPRIVLVLSVDCPSRVPSV
jgi:hypothetical protein